jgi:MFS family permease
LTDNPDRHPSPSNSPPKNRSIPFLIVVGLFGLGLGFLINILDPFIYTEKVRLLAPPSLKNTALSLITIITLLVALVTQPLIGRWSDRTHSRWGRRAPYLSGGVVGLSFSLVLLVVADNLWLLTGAAMLIAASSNTVQGTWQAFIPDQVPEAQRGTAAGIKTLLEIIGVIAGVILVGETLARGNLWAAPLTATGLFWGILLITLSTMSQLANRPGGQPTGQGRPASQLQGEGLQGEGLNNGAPLARLLFVHSLIRAVPGFSWWMLNRFLFWSAAIAIRTFSLNYMEDVLFLTPAEAQVLNSRLFLLMGLGVFLLTLPAGALADRFGRQPLLLVAGLMAASGATYLILVRNPNLLFIAVGLIGGGAGIFVSTSWALATDLVPKNQSALYLGLANGATVVGSIGGRLGGPLIDGVNQLSGTVTMGYLLVFGIAVLFFVGSNLVVLKIPKKRP